MGRRISLYFQSGSSDKVYHIQLVDRPGGMAEVNFQYGRRGNTLQHGSKTNGFVSLKEANIIFNKLVAEKTGKGYEGEEDQETVDSNGAAIQETVIKQPEVPQPKKVFIVPQLLNAIDEAEVERLINDDAYMAQEKKDGNRRLLISDGKIIGLNKKGEEVPVMENIANALPKNLLLTIDGELIGDKYHAFDILTIDKKPMREADAIRRHIVLSSITFGQEISVVHNAVTTEEKRKLYESLKENKKEGIVFKRKTSAYKPGRPNSGGDHLKFKFQNTASFIVDSITKDKRSIGVVLLDGTTRVQLGRCTIPPNHEMPKVGEIVEVQYLYAYEGGCIFQPVYLGKRDDIDANECIMKQLVYKSKEADTEV